MPVKLADYEGLPQAEIGRRLGISLAAAKSRIRRGRQRVRALLEECCVMVYDRRGKVVDTIAANLVTLRAAIKKIGRAQKILRLFDFRASA